MTIKFFYYDRPAYLILYLYTIQMRSFSTRSPGYENENACAIRFLLTALKAPSRKQMKLSLSSFLIRARARSNHAHAFGDVSRRSSMSSNFFHTPSLQILTSTPNDSISSLCSRSSFIPLAPPPDIASLQLAGAVSMVLLQL